MNMIAARQASLRSLLLHKSVQPVTVTATSFTRRIFSVALQPAAAVQSVTWRRATEGHSSRAGVRWYSVSNENQVPGSRIWQFHEIKKLVEMEGQEKSVVIVDVREPSELQSTGKIPGAINIPITSAVQSFHLSEEDFEEMYGYSRPPKDTQLLFYCKAGVRARAAAGLAHHAGWTDVGEYPGSWLDWETHRGPVEKVKSEGGSE